MNKISSKIICLNLCLLIFVDNALTTTYIKVTQEVFFDISIDKEYAGRIVIGLFGEDAPQTVKNFVTIATKGINGKTYAGTRFHRIIPRFVIHGGDIVNNDGTGSISIYGDHFPDENFYINHTSPGFVSMANFGRDTNGCQFFITTLETPQLDGYYVVFGKVIEGQNLVHKIEHLKRNYYTEKPLKEVVIEACGEIRVKKPYFIADHPYTFWAYVKAIGPPLTFSLTILAIFQWIMNRLDTGCKI